MPILGLIDNMPWTAYAPTITAGSGSFTSVVGTGAYKQIGKTVFFRAIVTITTNGTAALFVGVTLPVAAVNGSTAVTAYGTEIVATGKGLACHQDSNSNIRLRFSGDASYPGGNGIALVINGSYEAA